MLIRIASFDIGVKNFAIYVEDFEASDLKRMDPVSNIPNAENDRDIQNINAICRIGKRVLLQNSNLDDNGKEINSQIWYRNMIKILNKYEDIWNNTNIFIIEHQVVFNRVQIQLLAQVCYTYFLTLYGDTSAILYYNSKNKTKYLACPKDVDIKKWSANFAIKQLRKRKDIDGVEIIENSIKKDDLGDTFIQLQSFKYRLITKNGIYTKYTIKKRKKNVK